ESPNISRALGRARRVGLKFDVMSTSFFLGRCKVVLGASDGVIRIFDRIFIALGRFSADPSEFYQLPRDRVVELGARVSM
ncbi:MAG: potassium transporter Kup, partial [Albidovulum sp.]